MNDKNIRLVTAESVRAGHPDKLCDQIADAALDAYLEQDPKAKVALEVLATQGAICVAGEVTADAHVAFDEILVKSSTVSVTTAKIWVCGAVSRL